jgi:acyl dehydratase
MTANAPTASVPYSFATLPQFCGQVIGTSEWVAVGQDLINQFAECVDDHQWIHTDPERAARESPFGGTIAHGFLTLALLVPMLMDSGVIPGDVRHMVSCGVDRVRFLAPVRPGMRVRARVRLLSVRVLGEDSILIDTHNSVECEADGTVMLVADIQLRLTH